MKNDEQPADNLTKSSHVITIDKEEVQVIGIDYADRKPGSLRMRSSVARKFLRAHAPKAKLGGRFDVVVNFVCEGIGSDSDALMGFRFSGASAAVPGEVTLSFTFDHILWTNRRIRFDAKPAPRGASYYDIQASGDGTALAESVRAILRGEFDAEEIAGAAADGVTRNAQEPS